MADKEEKRQEIKGKMNIDEKNEINSKKKSKPTKAKELLDIINKYNSIMLRVHLTP